MITSTLKTFAPNMRRQLQDAVTRKLDYVLTNDSPDLRAAAAQIAELRREVKRDRVGLIERVAYTWFNRLAALRFLDAHHWHPFGARVLMPANASETQPELLKLMRNAALPAELTPFVSVKRLNDLLDGRLATAVRGAAPQGEVYRALFLAVCHFYHKLMPSLFEALDDETELLLPDDLLTSASVVESFRTQISDDDCAEVEVLGWLYQFYISEKKDAVMARKSAVPTEDIPAVTQLFTPHWIVRYLVENSLGRLWLLNRPGSRLREHMPYYIEESGQGAVVSGQSGGESDQRPVVSGQAGGGSNERGVYANQNLQGSDRVAESDGSGGTNIQAHQGLSERGNLRVDQSTSTSSGIGAVEYRGRTSPSIDSRIQKLSVDSAGVIGRGGNATAFGDSLRVSDPTAGGHSPQSARGDQQNAIKSAQQAGELVTSGKWSGASGQGQGVVSGQGPVISKNTTPPTDHWSLTTNHSSSPTDHWSLTTDHLKISKPEDIRLCDPAVGSGHMLTYAFDLLYAIYEEEGYAPSEIPALILRHNLCGLDICPRAAQLAELALVFKAREKSRRFFQSAHFVRPNIIELCDVSFTDGELRDYIHALKLGALFDQPMLTLMHQFEEAKNFGSLIQPCLDERAIANARRAITDHWSLTTDHAPSLFLRETHLKVLRVLEQAEALTQRYHVVVTNPPYMGGKQFNPTLKSFGKRSFPDSRADLFSMFIERGYSLVKSSGYSALVTMESWMFLSSFESFRVNVLSNHTTISMVHMPYLGRGGTSMGINFGTAAAIWQNAPNPSFKGQFQCIRYFECDTAGVPTNFPTRNDRYGMASSEDFLQVSGAPVAYWVTDRVRSLFKSAKSFKSVASPKVGMQTANNAKYLRFWFEVNFPEFQPSQLGSPKWVKYLKGGPFRRWYGNLDYLLRYNKSPDFILSQPNATLLPLSKLREPKCTWTDLTSGTFSCRLAPDDSFHDISGHCFYPSASEQKVLLGLSNTKVFAYFLSLINSSFHFQVGDVGRVPVVLPDNNKIEAIVSDALSLSISDWDNFETSWDFRDQPLLRPGLKGATLEASWRNWEAQSTAAIRRMQELETENNRLFIAAYSLQDELSPEVPEAQITLARADLRRDMAAFLSYAIGCIMGRYSPHQPGLILANAGDTLEDYWRRVGSGKWPVASGQWQVTSSNTLPLTTDHLLLTTSHSPLTTDHLLLATNTSPLATDPLPMATKFSPDQDGIIPVLDGEWFSDDIVTQVREFLRVTFGEATLHDNVRFIEDALGKDLRKYFLSDFYKDHLQTYKKRPIYWLFSSPKKGFMALIYLHRYTKDTANHVLNHYLREYIAKLRARIAQLDAELTHEGLSSRDKTNLRKQGDQLRKTLHECEDWERDVLLPLAQQRLDLDLDDGVKVNYLKLGAALSPIAGLAAADDE